MNSQNKQFPVLALSLRNITEAIIEKANEWQNRPLESIYPIIFMDATILKIRVDRVVKK